jgi:ABC-type polysaccharide transport system permease subunit
MVNVSFRATRIGVVPCIMRNERVFILLLLAQFFWSLSLRLPIFGEVIATQEFNNKFSLVSIIFVRVLQYVIAYISGCDYKLN